MSIEYVLVWDAFDQRCLFKVYTEGRYDADVASTLQLVTIGLYKAESLGMRRAGRLSLADRREGFAFV